MGSCKWLVEMERAKGFEPSNFTYMRSPRCCMELGGAPRFVELALVPKGSFQVTRTDDALELHAGPAVGSRVGLFWL